MKTIHREWNIDATAQHMGGLFRSCAEVTRLNCEGWAQGDRFVFTDLGDFAEKSTAEMRATTWVKKWIDQNYA